MGGSTGETHFFSCTIRVHGNPLACPSPCSPVLASPVTLQDLSFALLPLKLHIPVVPSLLSSLPFPSLSSLSPLNFLSHSLLSLRQILLVLENSSYFRPFFLPFFLLQTPLTLHISFPGVLFPFPNLSSLLSLSQAPFTLQTPFPSHPSPLLERSGCLSPPLSLPPLHGGTMCC